MKYKYCVEDEGLECAREFTSDWNTDNEWDKEFLAEDAAKDLWWDSDLSGDNFPVVIKLYHENSDYIGTYNIELEFEPSFYVKKVEQ